MLLVFACSTVFLLAGAASAASDVVATAAINGVSLDDLGPTDEFELDPDSEAELFVEVTNGTDEELTVRVVRLRGAVMGASFFSYDTAVGMTIEPGETEDRRFAIDLFALKEQAVGLIPAEIVLLTQEREQIAGWSFIGDVKGSLNSTYGTFGIAIAILTAIGTGHVLLKLVQGELPDSRFARAGTFGLPGAGIGLTVIFTLSVFRLFAPTTERGVVVGTAIAFIAFGIGYLTPSPDSKGKPKEVKDKTRGLAASPGYWLGAAGVLFVAFIVALVGIGSPNRDSDLKGADVSINGQDATAAELELDVGSPIEVVVSDLPAELAGVDSARLDFSIAGVELTSGASDVIAEGDDLVARVDASARSFLVGGDFSGDLDLIADNSVVATHHFGVETGDPLWLSAPAPLVAGAFLLAFAMLEGLNRRWRSGKRSSRLSLTSSMIGFGVLLALAITGAVWLLGSKEPTLATVVVNILLGVAGGVIVTAGSYRDETASVEDVGERTLAAQN